MNTVRQNGGAKRTFPHKRHRWFGSISHKLMLFVVLLCVLLLGLVWGLNVSLLEPNYHRMIENDLKGTAASYAAIIQKYVAEYGSILNGDGVVRDDFSTEINDTVSRAGKCVEIAGADCMVLLRAHNLSGKCQLHPTVSTMLGDRQETVWNAKDAVTLRALTLNYGDQEITLAKQKFYSKNVDGMYTVIVSTDLERIGQAGQVMARQMPVIAALLLLISILGAFLFSHWFTKPLSEISGAAREVAKGNYRVRVKRRSNDEIGMLAEDFNTMAAEVARTSELQRDLIANISHDLRTPLTLIKGYAETVRDLSGEDREKRTEQLSVIIDETDRLSALVNSVMELSRYSSGAEKINAVTFDLAQFCDEVAYRYTDICAKNGYTLAVQADEECLINADPNMMSRVIHNLLGNAVHHVGADGWLGLRVFRTPQNKVRVEVEDHGAGIAKEDLPYIFDKYYRARADAGKVGTGLGLSITKAILINHGYQFGVQSTLNQGSTFWFEAQLAAPPKQ